MVEVSYTSLRAVYPVLDSYSFPLVRSRVRCVCDCPGGAAHCPADLCGNTTNCHTHYSPSVPSTGCFLSWLQLSASLCCSIQVSATCLVSRVTLVTRVTTDRAVQHAGQHAPRGAAGAPQHPGAVQDHAEERDGARGGLQDLQHGPQQRWHQLLCLVVTVCCRRGAGLVHDAAPQQPGPRLGGARGLVPGAGLLNPPHPGGGPRI